MSVKISSKIVLPEKRQCFTNAFLKKRKKNEGINS
jgi:hypothetical protein